MHPGQTSLAEAVHREDIRIFAQRSRASTAAVSAVTGPGFTGRYCRQSAGKREEAYPVAVRLGGCGYQEGGSTLEDCVAACRIPEQSGADLIGVGRAIFHNPHGAD